MERAGLVVTREELRQTLWPADTFVDYDNGLNAAVKKLRAALSDSAENPRFVETVDRRGYRFIAPLHKPVHDPQHAQDSGASPAHKEVQIDSFESAVAGDANGVTSLSHNARSNSSNNSHTGGYSNNLGVIAKYESSIEVSNSRNQSFTSSPAPPDESSVRHSLAWAAVALLLAAFTTYVIWHHIAGTARVPSRVMLAVLPFDNFTGDSEQEYFSDGLTEEMILQLGQLAPERLGVIARTSVMGYKHNTGRLDQIGRDLGVQYVLEGSVRRYADRLRITAQLIQVKDQTHLWAQSYDRKPEDVLSIQGEVARAIADQIQLKVDPEVFNKQRNHPVSATAYESYLKGRHFWNARTSEGFTKALQNFQKTIQEDPNYAPAYAGLADSYLLLQEYGMVAENESQPRAERAALKALQLDDHLAEAHTSLAAMRASFHWDWEGAEKEYRRAIALNPNYATAHQWYAELLSSMARHKEAIAEVKMAQQLDPLSLITNTVAGEIFYFARRYDDAIQQCRKSLELDSSFAPAYSFIGQAYEQKRDYKQAEVMLTKAINFSGGSPKSTAFLGHVYAISGRAPEAERILQRVKEQTKERYVSPLDLALLYGAMGNRDQAFASLEEACSKRDHWLLYLTYLPLLNSAEF